MSSLTFQRVASAEPVVNYLADLLSSKLSEGQKVLWLVSGGSAIGIEAAIARKLKNAELENLIVTLVDERFGPVGHADSNWQQLQDAGFSLYDAKLAPVLVGDNIENTARQFAENLKKAFAAADYRVALMGIGPDGHTAGILPDTPSVKAVGWATSYHTEQYDRITMTAEAIAKLDEAVVYAMGDTKRGPLEDLQQELSLEEQPAQILKSVAKVTIFNDQIGDMA